MTSGKVARRLRKQNPPTEKKPIVPSNGEFLVQLPGKKTPTRMNRKQARGLGIR